MKHETVYKYKELIHKYLYTGGLKTFDLPEGLLKKSPHFQGKAFKNNVSPIL